MPEFAAFFSYSSFDDEHDGDFLSQFRLRLSAEVRMQTGREFLIFQDRNDILWGQRWRDRIEQTLDSTTFLLSVLTPSYFQSENCLDEVRRFMKREEALGVSDLILPLYYVESVEMEEQSDDPIPADLRQRNWYDWRNMRFVPLDQPEARKELAKLAKQIARRMRQPTVAAPVQADVDPDADESPGVLELLAEAEGAMPLLTSSLEGLSQEVESFGAITKEAGEAMQVASARPNPSRGRLAVVQKYAQQLKEPAGRMEAMAAEYGEQLARVDGGIEAMSRQIRQTGDPEDLEAARNLHVSLVHLVDNARIGLPAIQSMLNTMTTTGSLSSTLKPQYKRISTALRPVVQSIEVIESWEQRIGAAVEEAEERFPSADPAPSEE